MGSASSERCALESISHIEKRVCLMWGSPELDIYISRLIMDARDGQRQGLPVAVGAELLFLARTNKIIRAINLSRDHKVPWKEALQQVEEGDQRRLEADAFDNPLVSRDTVIRTRDAEAERRAGNERRQVARRSSDPSPVFGLVFRLATNKLTIGLIVFALALKLLWPMFFGAPRG